VKIETTLKELFEAMVMLMLAILVLSVSLANLLVIFTSITPMFSLLIGSWITVLFIYGVMYFMKVKYS
jgi:hypothetical protein